MKVTRQRLMEIIKEEYNAMSSSDNKENLNEAVVTEDRSQSEVAVLAIEAAVSVTLNTLLSELVPESEISTMLNNITNAIRNRVGDDLRNIYEEPPPASMSEAVMTQEPIDIIDELRNVTNKLSSVAGNSQPFQELASDMISQINDLEELLSMEE